MNRPLLAAAILSLVFLGTILVAGCTTTPQLSSDSGGMSSDEDAEVSDLDYVEVQEYEGKDLSSINDFRENSIKGPQTVDADTYRLKITGLVDQPTELTYAEVLESHEPFKKAVTLNCVEGWSVDILWEGVLLSDVIDAAGADPDASVVILRAVDGYSTSLPMEYIRSRDILMAYKMNDVELPPERGYPFQLVAERKWGYKWIKWIEEIEISNDKEFRGYWEQRGYSDDGDLTGDFYE